jgi:ABC-type antimicrobial peptide transport system permease subunit
MINNYFRVAWRHIIHHKVYAFINVIGLALGICGCLVIYLIASFEFSFDNFHPDKERIYCVDPGVSGSTDDHAHWNAVPAPLPAAMRQEMSGLEKVAAFQRYKAKITLPDGSKQPKKFDGNDGIIITEPHYFDILKYTWLIGNAETALKHPNTVVLTEKRARIYFGDQLPDKIIGKTIIYNDSLKVTVTGILKDWNQNSDFNYSDFISYATIPGSFLKKQIALDNWFTLDHSSQVLVKLAKGVNPARVNAQFPALIKKHLDPRPDSKLHIQLQPFTGIHFHAEYGGEERKANLPVLYILMAVAVFILIIAIVNFVNLSTAQSVQRTREIGIRKILGSSRKKLIFQFLTETFILSVLAVCLAVAFVQPVIGAFSSYIPLGVRFQLFDGATLLFLVFITVLTTLLAGFYPAKLLAGFLPVLSLKGVEVQRGSHKSYLRKSLIVFQFTISLIFIIAAIVISNQVKYVLTKDLGFKTDAVITLPSLWNDHTGKMKVLKEKIKQLPGVDQVILEAFPPIGLAHMGNGLQLKDSSQPPIQASEHVGNEDFVPFYQMKLLAGRNLVHTDSTREFLINQTCARALGFANPIKALGKFLVLGGSNKAFPVVGVVTDFYENSFHQQISPIVIAHDPGIENGIAIKISLRGKQAGDVQSLIGSVETQWKVFYPEEPFTYSFLDDSIAQLYKSDLQAEWLINTAMLVTIFISCMGLFGLAMFTTQKRTKEIGIRKVLGASVINIMTMLSREITWLIILALIIASPVAWVCMHSWLQGFAYRITVSFWVFIQAGVGALLISLITISFLATKAAMTNPIKSLRSE